MTATGGDGDRLAALLKGLAGKAAERCPAGCFDGADERCVLLVYSFLLWESTPKQAAAALRRLSESVIDLNDLRVALPAEIVELSGMRDGQALERAQRLRAALNDLFRKEHAVSLARLEDLSKREAREVLDGLDGMPSFVAARVTLLGFGGHATPVDARLVTLLAGEGVLEAKTPPGEAERWLERQIRASESEEAMLALEAWRDETKVRGAGKAGRSGAKSRRETAAGGGAKSKRKA